MPTDRRAQFQQRLAAAASARATKRLPAPPPQPNGDAEAIARIDDLSKLARTTWFGLLAYLAFVGITLLGVEDADFFVPSRQTQLPLVNVSIPTADFFVFAPFLGAALYIYLHLQLMRLWDALALPPPVAHGRALGERVYPWLINELALSLRPDAATRAHDLRWLSSLVTRVLVWASGPVVLVGFWWRSWPAHSEWLTLVIAACLLLSLYVGFTSWWAAGARLQRLEETPWRARWKRPLGFAVALIVLFISWVRTGGFHEETVQAIALYELLSDERLFDSNVTETGVEQPYERVRDDWVLKNIAFSNHFLAQTDLSGVNLSDVPKDWLPCDLARKDFIDEYRKRERKTEDWTPLSDEDFLTEWTRRRTNALANIEAVDFSGRDLRNTDFIDARAAGARFPALPWSRARIDVDIFDGSNFFSNRFCALDLEAVDFTGMSLAEARLGGANLRGASFTRGDLSFAVLEGADLRGARLDGANLVEARLEGADLRGARLEGANLVEARLEGANLRAARLEGANLVLARLEGANLREARLEQGVLVEARLQGADLRDARLEEGVLVEARLEGADLRYASLERADLRRARLEGANLRGAWLEGANLLEAQLQQAVLFEAGLDGARLSGARLEGADLGVARLQGAYLREAQLQGADLRRAGLQSTKWAGATNSGSPAHFADFRGGEGLTQSMLENVIGNAATLLPDTPDPVTGEHFSVLTCWKDVPERWKDREFPDAWRCPAGTDPAPTGTPLALDAPIPYHIRAMRRAEGIRD